MKKIILILGICFGLMSFKTLHIVSKNKTPDGTCYYQIKNFQKWADSAGIKLYFVDYDCKFEKRIIGKNLTLTNKEWKKYF